MHEVYLTRRAQKEIEKLSHEAQDRVLDAIDDLMEDPVPPGSRKLKGDLFGEGLDYYRIRVGDYRVIYTLDEKDYDVLVARVRHRRDAYRRALASGARDPVVDLFFRQTLSTETPCDHGRNDSRGRTGRLGHRGPK